MVNKQILDYIEQQLNQGISRDVIKQNLVASGGWHPNDIDEAFVTLDQTKNIPSSSFVPRAPMEKTKTSFVKKITVIIVIAVVLITIVGIYIYFQKNNSSTANIQNTLYNATNSSTNVNPVPTSYGQIILEQNPYINSSLGFQINLPAGWSTTINKNNPNTVLVSDPNLKYTSEISITSVPATDFGTSVDLTNTATQDNLVKSILGAFSSGAGFTLQGNNRISSTTVEINFTQSISGLTYNSSDYLYFTSRRLYEVVKKISTTDSSAQYVTQLLSASFNTFKIIQ